MAYSYDDRDREFRQSPPPRPPRKEDNDLGSWILIIFLFIVAWPAGLAVLLSKVLGNDSRRKNAARSTRSTVSRSDPAVSRANPNPSQARPGTGLGRVGICPGHGRVTAGHSRPGASGGIFPPGVVSQHLRQQHRQPRRPCHDEQKDNQDPGSQIVVLFPGRSGRRRLPELPVPVVIGIGHHCSPFGRSLRLLPCSSTT